MVKRISSPSPFSSSSKSKTCSLPLSFSYWKLATLAMMILVLSITTAFIFKIGVKQREHFNSSNSFTVVYVYSDSCGYCTKFKPVYEAYTKQQEANPISQISVKSYEKSAPGAEDYMSYVSAFPTILIFDSNKSMISSKTGYMSLGDLSEYVKGATS